MCGGSRHEVPDVVPGQEVLYRGVTAPPRPELVEAVGRSMAGLIVGVPAPPRPELVEAGGRSVARQIVEVVGDVFRVILIVFRVET